MFLDRLVQFAFFAGGIPRGDRVGALAALLDGDAGLSEQPGDSLLNARNRNPQKSCLVVEVICKGPVKQTDAVQPCLGATKVKVPPKGSRVSVVGPYVKDTEGGHGWMELHPVTSIVVIP
jgi:hypothetical protein